MMDKNDAYWLVLAVTISALIFFTGLYAGKAEEQRSQLQTSIDTVIKTLANYNFEVDNNNYEKDPTQNEAQETEEGDR